MIDSPWSGKKLSKGQIIQRLKSAGCVEVKEHVPGSALWKDPTGHFFSVSFADIDGETLEAIVREVEDRVRSFPGSRS